VSAESQARIAENRRMQGINEAVGQINALYSSSGRQRQYDDLLGALRERYQYDLGDQKKTADRRGKFAMARRGLTSGSADFDARRRRGEDFMRALVGSENQAQATIGKLRQQDDSTRRSMLAMAYGGMDAGTGAQRAQQMMSANIQGAQADFIPYALDSIGEAAADAYGVGVRDDAYTQGGEDARRRLYGYG
jgi:hypothetical protein